MGRRPTIIRAGAPAPHVQPRRHVGPGDVVAATVKALTLGRVRMCAGCKGRRRKLNRLGWLGLVLPWRWFK